MKTTQRQLITVNGGFRQKLSLEPKGLTAAARSSSRRPGRAAATLLATAAALLFGGSLAHSEPPKPPAFADTFTDRLAVLALIESLNADLLASHSATRTLEAWCADHHMAAEAKIHARRVLGADKEISAESRRRLGIGDDTPVKYRRVELTCGDHILSQADNWYVPERLTPEMNRILETTDRPFGAVVKDLSFHRRTISMKRLWQPLAPEWELAAPPADHGAQQLGVPELLFEHRAVLEKPDGQPFSEVVETYRRDILDFARGGF